MKEVIKPKVLKFNYDARINYICYGFDGLNGCMLFYQGRYGELGVDLNPFGDTLFVKVDNLEVINDDTLLISYKIHSKEETVKISSKKQYVNICYKKVMDIYKNGFKFPTPDSILDTIDFVIEDGKIKEFIVYKECKSEKIGSFCIFHEDGKLNCVNFNPWSRYIVDHITLKDREITCVGEGNQTSFKFDTSIELTETIFSLLKTVEDICIKI